MSLTPLDIHNKEFPRKWFGGYDRDTVDEFLNEIIRQMEVLLREQTHFKEQIDNLNAKLEQYRNLEETINKTLIVAQETAEDVRTNARKEAELIIQDARLQAERIIEGGQAKSRRITEETADLARVAHTLRTQIRSVLQSQMSAIDSIQESFAQAAIAKLPQEAGHEPAARQVASTEPASAND